MLDKYHRTHCIVRTYERDSNDLAVEEESSGPRNPVDGVLHTSVNARAVFILRKETSITMNTQNRRKKHEKR